MSTKQTFDKSQLLTDLPPYIYGTTRLGDEKIPFEERVKVARAAMQGVDWFHTSHTYGNALKVLRAAFDQDRTRVPKLIVKIGWSACWRTAGCHPSKHRSAGIGRLGAGSVMFERGICRRLCKWR